MANTILIVDDDSQLADNIRLYLERYDWETHVEYSAETGLKKLKTLHPDILLTDHMMPGMTGIDLIKQVQEVDPNIKIVMLTGEGSLQVAVDAMKAGASDYLSKPASLAELKVVLDKTLGQAQMEKTLSVYQRSKSRGASLDAIIGESAPTAAVKAKVRQILEAEKQITSGELPSILINGETGTGKELLARALHFDGARKDKPFIEINCASLPNNLLESELFGHEKGAFTDAKESRVGLAEAADGGTLFLDEIGEIDLALQAKLLTLLEQKIMRRVGSVRERKVNIRIISATNQDLEKMVREGRFRSDLYFRLRVITLATAPLRTTGQDILRIAEFYLQLHARHYGKKNLYFTPAAEQLLLAYTWPGNVRELRNTLEQTVLLAGNQAIDADQIAISTGLMNDARVINDRRNPIQDTAPKPQFLEKVATNISDDNQDLLKKTLEKTGWNVSKSAKLLGLTRDMMRYRIEKYGLYAPQD
jgi:two-component system, NtrC family, response regulator AtoC